MYTSARVLFSDQAPREFNDEIGKAAAESAIAATPDEWKKDLFASALTYRGVSHFHLPGIVYGADVVVAIPNHK